MNTAYIPGDGGKGYGVTHIYYIHRLSPHNNHFAKKSKKEKSVDLTRVCPKVSGLAAWSENCKWYRSLPLGAVV
jgi:hypothetical protein